MLDTGCNNSQLCAYISIRANYQSPRKKFPIVLVDFLSFIDQLGANQFLNDISWFYNNFLNHFPTKFIRKNWSRVKKWTKIIYQSMFLKLPRVKSSPWLISMVITRRGHHPRPFTSLFQWFQWHGYLKKKGISLADFRM